MVLIPFANPILLTTEEFLRSKHATLERISKLKNDREEDLQRIEMDKSEIKRDIRLYDEWLKKEEKCQTLPIK